MKIYSTYMRLREPYADPVEGKLPRGGPRKPCLNCDRHQYNRLCILWIDDEGTKKMQHVCMDCLYDVFEVGRVIKAAGKVTKRSKLHCYLCERGLCKPCRAKGLDRKRVSAIGGLFLKNGVDPVGVCLDCVKYRCLKIEPTEH